MADVGRLSWQCLAGAQRLAASHSCGSVTEPCNILTLFSRLGGVFSTKEQPFYWNYIACTGMRYFIAI